MVAILQVHNQARPLSGVDLAVWAGQTQDWNGADLALMSNQAALEAVRDYWAQGGEDPRQIQITTVHFQRAFEVLQLQKQVTQTSEGGLWGHDRPCCLEFPIPMENPLMFRGGVSLRQCMSLTSAIALLHNPWRSR